MTRIESDKTEIAQSPEAVFQFLSDFNNFQQLMPEQVTDWVSDTETCSFNIKGMASLGMAMDSKTPNSEVKIKRNGKAPFDFFLYCNITPGATPTTSNLQLAFDADLNPFLKMMAEKPLTNFLNLLVKKYQSLARDSQN
ncbi:MAG: SRPBCC family protein [Bacteroidia bacterium]|nr:SRPBCC family protein [Bacteroidota bacterium]MBK8875379.1 SRPBCC family protein [Bacteroidota bacterium]MBK9048926.1 SRPBCC family protein [Bacteroidota bacterium]MBK9424292.1 SRPBCC family protein [Bacteroidota bacterium]MBP9083272.1 SRPBCC family protein [Bacteroidia bacterium]